MREIISIFCIAAAKILEEMLEWELRIAVAVAPITNYELLLELRVESWELRLGSLSLTITNDELLLELRVESWELRVGSLTLTMTNYEWRIS